MRRRVRSYLPCEQVNRDDRKEFRMYHPRSGVREEELAGVRGVNVSKTIGK